MFYVHFDAFKRVGNGDDPFFLLDGQLSTRRCLVIEVKAGDEQPEYERNKIEYKKNEQVFNTVFAKELGFVEFNRLDKEFEYRVVFSTSLREWQK